MTARRRRWLVSVGFPGVIVAVLLAVTLSTDHPVSGMDVTVLATRCARPTNTAACRAVAYPALIQVRKVGSHEVITGHRPGPGGRMRLGLPPGQYDLVPRAASPGLPPGVARIQRVRVREDQYTPVTVLYRLRVSGRRVGLR
jgi:hypothetical protein